jgi:hypothetical protein
VVDVYQPPAAVDQHRAQLVALVEAEVERLVERLAAGDAADPAQSTTNRNGAPLQRHQTAGLTAA